MKKIVLFFIVIIGFLLIYFSRQCVLFIYLNPHTYTKPFSYLVPVIKDMDGAFDYAKKSASSQGYKFKYLYFNAYGSGFIENNDMPNDLDYAVGIDLGEYKYDGKNGEEIAKNMIEKMNIFNSSFNFYYNSSSNAHTVINKTYFETLEEQNRQYKKSVNNISNSLENAINGNNYIMYTEKTVISDGKEMKIDVPYIMKPYEILIEERHPIKLYSDLVKYNEKMLQYPREISIVAEFFATINKNGKKYRIELVPESFLGERLQLKRRLFTSCVFIHTTSIPFLLNIDYINNDDKYLYYRKLSFRRHLQEINNIISTEERIFKLFKRIPQTAEIIGPVLNQENYDEIMKFSKNKFSDKNIWLLNEYYNLFSNIYDITLQKSLYIKLFENKKLNHMSALLDRNISDMNDSKIKKDDINELKYYNQEFIKPVCNENDNITLKSNLINEHDNIIEKAFSSLPQDILEPDKIVHFIQTFNKIYTNAGYHKLTLYWIDKNTIGVVENDFSKTIKDFKKLAQENDMTDNVNYKLIKESDIKDDSLMYDVFVRYNSSDEENKNGEEMNNILLKDKKNYNLKFKPVFKR